MDNKLLKNRINRLNKRLDRRTNRNFSQKSKIYMLTILIFILILTILLCVFINPVDKNWIISNYKNIDYSDRVFNIGLHRTGTSSLAEALSMLGYKVWHGPYFKKLENDYYTKFNALVDTQVVGDNHPDFNFKKLYKKFPNAKFILTVRNDLDKWCKSIDKTNLKYRDHMIVLPESYLSTLNMYNDIITDVDIKDVTHDDLKNAYKNHANDVIDFFKDKPGQLLIFNIIDGDGWEKLCKFLNKDLPNQEKFPYINELYITFKLSFKKLIGYNNF